MLLEGLAIRMVKSLKRHTGVKVKKLEEYCESDIINRTDNLYEAWERECKGDYFMRKFAIQTVCVLIQKIR
jgi:hypothetical protein